MFVDSWPINKITIKYRYPIPILKDLIDKLYGATIFSKIHLRSGHYCVRICEGNDWKIAFQTKGRLYEQLVMPFSLIITPSTFMRFGNQCSSLWGYTLMIFWCTASLRKNMLTVCIKQSRFPAHENSMVILGSVICLLLRSCFLVILCPQSESKLMRVRSKPLENGQYLPHFSKSEAFIVWAAFLGDSWRILAP